MSWAEVMKINSDLTKPLNELITETIGGGQSSVIKSIQRGVVDNRAASESNYIKSSNTVVTISEINPDKSIVLVNGLCWTNNGTNTPPQLVSLSSTSITFDNSTYFDGSTYSGIFSWQVIEFV